jgi:chromosome segregation ATPase
VAGEQNGAKIAALRETLDKWVAMQKALSKERSEAQSAIQMLQQRTELVVNELEDVKTKKTESDSKITEADLKKAELVTKKEEMQKAMEQVEGEMPTIEADLLSLKAQLPDPIQQKLAPLYERMPKPGEQKKVALAERFQNVVGILNEVNKASGEISLVNEQRTLSDGKLTEVSTLYIGLGQAYYVNATGRLSGYGRPGEAGWVWKQDDSIASKVRLAIAMLKSKSAAKFVPVPMQID